MATERRKAGHQSQLVGADAWAIKSLCSYFVYLPFETLLAPSFGQMPSGVTTCRLKGTVPWASGWAAMLHKLAHSRDRQWTLEGMTMPKAVGNAAGAEVE